MTVETADDFATVLFEEAKAFLTKYDSNRSIEAAEAYLHAALLLGFCALEANINNVAADFADRTEFSLLEQSILKEREVALKHGRFELGDMLKIFRLEERFEFLYRRFKGEPVDKDAVWWGALKRGLDIRNAVTHPRLPRPVTEKDVTESLSAVLEAVDALFLAVYGRAYPGKGRRLDSLLDL